MSNNREPSASAGGVRIVNLSKRPELNGMFGDILGFDESTGRHTVKIRGAACSGPLSAGVLVRPENLMSILDIVEMKCDEEERQALIQRVGKEEKEGGTPPYLNALMEAMSLKDAINFNLQLHYRRPALPKDVAHRLHINIAREYFMTQTITFPGFTPDNLTHSLEPFYEERGNRFYQSTSENITRFISSGLESAIMSRSEFDATILTRAFVFAVNRLGASDATLTVPINAVWTSFCFLDGECKEYLTPAINRHFSSNGTPDFTCDDLLWCFCCLYVQLCKDLRVYHAENKEVRTHEKTDQQVECAKTAIRVRPHSPRSYMVAAYLLQDTMEICHPTEQMPRSRLAFHYAIVGLDLAKRTKDPFYLHCFHLLAAYWKMTSGNTKPYTIAEVRAHLGEAEGFKNDCKGYIKPFEFHGAQQTRKHIRCVLSQIKSDGMPSEDSILRQPLTLAPFEEASHSSTILKGHEQGGKMERLGFKYHCAHCNGLAINLLRCSRCKKVSYCSENCQRLAWKVHKKECRKKKK